MRITQLARSLAACANVVYMRVHVCASVHGPSACACTLCACFCACMRASACVHMRAIASCTCVVWVLFLGFERHPFPVRSPGGWCIWLLLVVACCWRACCYLLYVLMAIDQIRLSAALRDPAGGYGLCPPVRGTRIRVISLKLYEAHITRTRVAV